jgi:branched-subunit amino acid ABC-type transport system permease component
MGRLLTVLVAALPMGSVYALAAAGLVLTYRSSRVFNFAHGAVGMASAYVFYQVWVVWQVPLPVAFALVAGVFAPVAGLGLERTLFRSLRGAATSVKVVATIGLLLGLQGTVSLIWGQRALFLPQLFPQGSVRIPGGVRMGFDQLSILAISLATLVGLGALLRLTPLGLRIRGSVDRRDLAELVGIDTNRVSSFSWALGFSTAAVAGILLSPVLGLDSFILTLFVIQAFAAALFGRLESFPLTLLGGLIVAFLEQAASAYLPAGCGICLTARPAVPFALMFAILAYAALMPRTSLGRWVRTSTTERAAPPPAPLAPSSRNRSPLIAVAIVVALLAAAGPFMGTELLLKSERGLAMAGVFASLVILAGLSGQISLAHTAFAGTGAFTMAFLAGQVGLPFPVAMVLAGVAAVPLAIFVALPAIRLQGLHVALLTFGFGLVVEKFFESGLTNGTTGMAVPRPSVARSDLAYFFVLLGIAAALVLIAANLQRSPTGRVLSAIRDSEAAARSIGVNLPIYRLAVFSLSAFMAGIAGAALGASQGLVTFQDFHPLLALVWLAVAVIGGLGSPSGAVAASVIWAFGATSVGALPQVAFGIGAMLLARSERGLAGSLQSLRERLPSIRSAVGLAAAAHEGKVAPGAARGA